MSLCTEVADFACLGRRFEKGRMNILFAEIGRDLEQPSKWSVNKRTRSYSAGAVYAVRVSPDRMHAMFSEQAYQDFKGEHKETERVVAWRIADEAALCTQRLYKGSKKAGEAQKVLECLAPLRALHRGADRMNRRIIELTVLDYLRSA